MTRKELFKTFIFLKKESKGIFELSDIINNKLRLEVYEDFMHILTKIGFNDEESNMILGSLILTLENGKVEDIDEKTNPDIIEIPEVQDRSVGFVEYGRYKNFGTYFTSGTYSDVEALWKTNNGEWDDRDIHDSEYDMQDMDIDDSDINIT